MTLGAVIPVDFIDEESDPSCGNCPAFIPAFNRFTPALQQEMEIGMAVDTFVIGGVATIGEVGATELGLSGVDSEASTFFESTTYSDKVLKDMQMGDYHAFPRSVEAFADSGRVTVFRGGDGALYKMLEIPGGYKNADGLFQFIKDGQGLITHRYFMPVPSP